MMLLTNSSTKCYRRCARLYRLRYEQGYRSAVEAQPLRFGSLIHNGLEAWHLATGDDRLANAMAALAGEADPFDRVRAEAMVEGYHYRWQEEQLEVLAVEKEFRAPLVNPTTGYPSKTWLLAGKLDGVVRTRDGRVLILEHKTASGEVGAGSDYLKRLRLDSQISTYYAGARALGYDVAGCLYDVLSKPGQRPLKATALEARKYKKDGTPYANQREADETPEEHGARVREAIGAAPEQYFSRCEVVRLEAEMHEAMADAWQVAHSIRASQLGDVWPRNVDSCIAYGQVCAFWPVCSGEASLDDEEKFCRVGQVHGELLQLKKEEVAA